MLRPQETHTDVFVFFEHVDIAVLRPSALTAHIRQAIARPCRHRDSVGKIYVVVQQPVQHPACKNSAHAPAFQH